MKKFRLLLALGAIVALGLAVVACGDDDDDADSSSVSGTQSPTSTAAATGTAATAGTVKAAQHQLGTILVDARGMTLYRFTRDAENVSNCTGACLQTWPPLTIDSGTPTAGAGVTGKLGTIDSGGKKQVTLDGQPLYFFAADTAPGEAKGQNVGTIWFVVNPAGKPAAGATADSDYGY